MTTVLIVGARVRSLGAALARELSSHDVLTAGVSGEEDARLDLVHDDLHAFMKRHRPDHVVCTAGINSRRADLDHDGLVWWGDHMMANVVGPMRLLEAYVGIRMRPDLAVRLGHFVGVSSNSAHIPRTGSGPYCASKAALSMGLRVAAREAAREGMSHIVYGYEPGLLRGTPMTAETEARLPGVPLTRMRGAGVQNGLSVRALARHIGANLRSGGVELNGCMLRLDAGEL